MTRRGRPWSSAEDMILRRYYRIRGPHFVLDRLHRERTLRSIVIRASRLGLSAPRLWTDEEVELLRRYAGAMPLVKLRSEHFPHRTMKSLYCAVRRRVGSKRDEETVLNHAMQNWRHTPCR